MQPLCSPVPSSSWFSAFSLSITFCTGGVL
jgi:hypothetical protein